MVDRNYQSASAIRVVRHWKWTAPACL
jgi:hypothetical protein